MKWMFKLTWPAALAVALCACATTRSHKNLLRVGVTPNYPPLIMMQGDKASGIECDFAAQLSSELDCTLQLVQVPWDRLFDELDAGNIDIVMSGMTVMLPRKVRATFCEPYMNNPLVAITRRGESGSFLSSAEIVNAGVNIGVMNDTAADAFVRRYCSNAKILPIIARDDVGFYLANQRIDLYLDDMAAAIDIVSRDEARLELVPAAVAPQELAWAVRLGTAELQHAANAALARWRANGLLDRILNRWRPYREKFAGTALQM